jgi:hypothetical protein
MTGGFMAGGRTRFVMVGRHFRGLIAGSVLSDRVMRPMWPSVCGSGKRMTAFFAGTIFGAAAFRDSHCLKTEPVILQRSELGGRVPGRDKASACASPVF